MNCLRYCKVLKKMSFHWFSLLKIQLKPLHLVYKLSASESWDYALSHDACIGVICRDSFGLVLLLRPVNAAINIVGNEIDAPTSNRRNIITVVVRICCDVWTFGWSHEFCTAKVIKRTCGNIVRIFVFDSTFVSLFPPFSMASGVLVSSLSRRKQFFYKIIARLQLAYRLIGI